MASKSTKGKTPAPTAPNEQKVSTVPPVQAGVGGANSSEKSTDSAGKESPPTADRAAEKEYSVRSPLRHDGVDYAVDSPVTLTSAQAEPLIAAGVIE